MVFRFHPQSCCARMRSSSSVRCCSDLDAFASYRLRLSIEPLKAARPFLRDVFVEHADIGVLESSAKNVGKLSSQRP